MNIISFDCVPRQQAFCGTMQIQLIGLFFDSQKQEQRTQLVKSERGYLRTVLKNNPCDLVVMEACSTSGWVHDLCQELGIATLVCSTHEDAWRWRSVKRKTEEARKSQSLHSV